MSAEFAIRVMGRLTPGLVDALDPLVPTAETTETVLVGRVDDRSALHGLIARIEALGLELVELQRLPDRPDRACPSCGHAGEPGRDRNLTGRGASVT